jgi:hypothetical protein
VTLDLNRLMELVEPASAELYLRAHGWSARRESEMFSIWGRSDKRTAHLFVPRSREPDDYGRRLYDFVAKLSQIEERDPDVVATNLRYAASDLVRIRLHGPNVRAGEVPIEEGATLFEGTRKLMLAAACAAHDPKPFFGTRPPSEASNYIDGVRFGQTERGSYVVTVISDLSTTGQQTLLPDHAPAPFERRVTETLAEALVATKEAAQEFMRSAEDLAIFEERVPQGVSANLCEAIAYIGSGEVPTTIEVTVDWSAAWTRVTESLPVDVAFDPGEIKVVQLAASHLRQLGPYEGASVRGFVRHLDRGTADPVGRIVIDGLANDRRRSIYVELAGEAYSRAILAHEARQEVSLTGTLVKHGRHRVLLHPSDLEIVSSF